MGCRVNLEHGIVNNKIVLKLVDGELVALVNGEFLPGVFNLEITQDIDDVPTLHLDIVIDGESVVLAGNEEE